MAGPLSRSITQPVPDAYALVQLVHGAYVATLSGDVTVDATYPTVCKLDPGGSSRNVTLEAEDDAHGGTYRVFINAADAAENLVVKDPSANTVGTVNQNEMGVFYDQGSDGWTLLFVLSIALS